MTRVAIVADSEELRAELAAALRRSRAFQVIGTAVSMDELPDGAEVVLVAQNSHAEPFSSHPEPGARRAGDEGSALLGLDTSADAPSRTNREREVLALLADGLGNKQIAARLGISPNTVKTHLELLFERLGVSSRAEAVAVGVRRGLLLL